MKTFRRPAVGTIVLSAMILAGETLAGDVEILAAEFQNVGGNDWSVEVTLRHGDTGWDHYADNWRVVDGEGNVLGDRILYHPHVEEQPFTRGLSRVNLPAGVAIVFIEAHDKVHGWTQHRLEVNLRDASGGRLHIESN